ncbi:anoctamin-3-like isoform X2 [Athalia rosae]|uniref:anoctamin-3-like isoform X2 n=1 Tax=Athalia rosae TaxID=37344 RepID=UPI0020340C1B|nr:anoctamin-3-like isoform X2 [Athalia rosae]
MSTSKWEKHAYTTADRALIIWEIMWRTKFGPEPHQIGLLKLLNDHVFLTAYPLHDGYVEHWKNELPTHRQILYREWGNPKATFKYQPLNLICLYFGCEVGLYFTWLAFYNRMLLLPTVVGIVTFIFGIVTLHGDNSFVDELCSSQEKICGRCPDENHCSAYKLSDSCSYTKISYITDNNMTIFYTTFMALWATVFNKMWKQKLSMLSWYWNLHDSTTDYDMRPQYEIAATKYRYNSLTKRVHLEHNVYRKTWQVAISVTLIMVLTFTACSVYFGVILLRTTITHSLRISHNKILRWNSSIIAILVASMVNLCFILMLEIVYEKLAIILTNLENPRTRAEYDKSYTIKIYVLSFINYYSALVYIAFFKGKFFTHPGDHGRWNHMSGISMQQCDPAGCLSELSIQLAIIMCGKQVFLNIMEVIVPKILRWFKGKLNKFENLPRWEEDFLLRENEQFTLYMEVHEMVLQYGFVTLFVSTFPLAPMFALMNNIFEVRIDAHKMLCDLRRPFPRRVTSLGAWEDILEGVTYTAIVFNGLIIGFTSDFIPKLLYKIENGSLQGYVNDSLSIFATKHYGSTLKPDTCRYPGYRYPPDHPLAYELTPKYWYILCWQFIFLVIFEHFVFGVTRFISHAISDMPQYIKEKVQADKEFLRTLKDRTIGSDY